MEEFFSNWRKLRRSRGLNVFKLLQAGSELVCVVVLGKLFGISIITRYMANPNELITVPILKAFGATIGSGSRVKRRLYLDNVYSDKDSTGDLSRIQVGCNCYIGDGVYMDLANEVRLEDNVVLAGQVHFITHADCNRSEFLEQHFPRECAPIHIEESAWIGFNCTLLAGSRVGKNSVLGSNSLLKGEMDAESVYAGSPCTKVRTLTS